jgi:hypothetical protein
MHLQGHAREGLEFMESVEPAERVAASETAAIGTVAGAGRTTRRPGRPFRNWGREVEQKFNVVASFPMSELLAVDEYCVRNNVSRTFAIREAVRKLVAETEAAAK